MDPETRPGNDPAIVIGKLQNATEAGICARMMASTEPWITLQRDHDAALKIISDPVREVYDRGLKSVSDPAREVYVARSHNDIAGFIVLVMQGAFVGYIQSICVAPEWRSKGIGSSLIAFAERRIFNDSPNVFMCVSSFNPRAQRLYERLGYEVIGELKDYIVRGHSEILLRKSIGPRAEFEKR